MATSWDASVPTPPISRCMSADVVAMALGRHARCGILRLFSRGLGLSAAGSLTVVENTERKQRYDMSLVAIELTGNSVVTEFEDAEGGVAPYMFRPSPSDPWLVATTTSGGYTGPCFWNVLTRERRELLVGDLRGDLTFWNWSSDTAEPLLKVVVRIRHLSLRLRSVERRAAHVGRAAERQLRQRSFLFDRKDRRLSRCGDRTLPSRCVRALRPISAPNLVGRRPVLSQTLEVSSLHQQH